jgi:hypothetical protein
MYFPINGENVRFAAYYPHNTSADNNANTLTFNFTTQSTQTDKELKDFVFHKGTTDYSKSSSNVALSFQHKFSKIKITLIQGAGGPDLTTLTAVTLTKMPASATVDLAKLAANESDASAITVDPASTTISPYIYDKTITGATVEAIVAPHSGAGNFTGREFKFTADGKEYTYPLNNSVTFDSGKVYNFTLTLMPQGPFAPMHDGLTNCYLVAPSGHVTIPITRAITYGGMSANAAATVETLWDDNKVISISGLTGSGASRTFAVDATHATKQGNAVVALKGGDGTIYWSWHIWVSNYSGQTWTNNGFTFMDRNLGATAAGNSLNGRGLLYEWGRKDPFPSGVSGTAGYGNNAVNKFLFGSSYKVANNDPTDEGLIEGILESINKPTTFFVELTNLNWLPVHYDYLWYTSDNKKTIFDPCPEGWRVPSGNGVNSPWYGLPDVTAFTKGDHGGVTNWGNEWPAAGFIGRNSATYAGSGDSGLYWFADSANIQPRRMLFMNTGLTNLDTNVPSRAIGYSVRCVEEQ